MGPKPFCRTWKLLDYLMTEPVEHFSFFKSDNFGILFFKEVDLGLEKSKDQIKL